VLPRMRWKQAIATDEKTGLPICKLGSGEIEDAAQTVVLLDPGHQAAVVIRANVVSANSRAVRLEMRITAVRDLRSLSMASLPRGVQETGRLISSRKGFRRPDRNRSDVPSG